MNRAGYVNLLTLPDHQHDDDDDDDDDDENQNFAGNGDNFWSSSYFIF